MDQQRQNMRMVFFLLVSAVFCGIATYLGIVLLLNRNPRQATPSSSPVEVVVSSTSTALDPGEDGWGLLGSEPRSELLAEMDRANMQLPIQMEDDLAVSVTMAPLPIPSATPSEILVIDYRVQPGDTLYSIAQKQNTSIDLLAVYGISAGNLIAGGVISLPVANPAFCPAMLPYVVHDGDTVFSIAQRYNSTTEAIASINHLDSNYTIRTADVLCIP